MNETDLIWGRTLILLYLFTDLFTDLFIYLKVEQLILILSLCVLELKGQTWPFIRLV